MSTSPAQVVPWQSEGGVAADHPPQVTFPVLAGPTPAQDFNRIRLSIYPVACLRLNDLRFELILLRSFRRDRKEASHGAAGK